MNSEKFNFVDISVPSKNTVCDRCKAEGLNINIIAVPLEFGEDKTKPTPKSLAILCKKCLNIEKVSYEEWLRLVNLKPIGET